MRQNVEIDDDLLRAAAKIATEDKTTPGRVISDLARQALSRRLSVDQLPIRNGFRYLPKRGGVVTPELVKRLAENEL